MAIKKDKKIWNGKTILVVNSGTERQRFVFETAKKLGLKVVILNDRQNWSTKYAKDFLLADNFNHAKVLTILRAYLQKHKIDGVVTFEEEDVELTAKIAEEFNLIGNGVKTALLTRNKYLMRKQLVALQVLQPNFMRITNSADLQQAIKKIRFPAIIKPVAGTGNFFVVKVGDEDEAKEVFDYVKKNATPKFDPIFNYNGYEFLFESYADGPEVSVEAVTQNGQTVIVAVVDKHTSDDPYFIELSDSLPSKFDKATLEKIERAVLASHRAVGITNGVSHTELCVTDKGPEVIEIASRMSGKYIWDGVKAVWGVDLAEQAFRVALGLPMTADKSYLEPKKYWFCRFLEIQDSGILTAIHGAKEAEKTEGVREMCLDKEVGDAVLEPPEGFDVMGWIVGQGESHSEAQEVAEDARAKLDIQIIPFDPESSVGKSRRASRFSSAFVTRRKILAQAKIEKLRNIDIKNLRSLHIGVLGNMYKNSGTTQDRSEVANELMSVGLEIQNTLRARGYKVDFFDMNESPLPIEKISRLGIDLMFNVCERINDSSLLEPH
ncbi:ATP-grasp domain-containing protein, partial [Patescibacteria group bacterium]|nr:ATP-grasp domain-containing protein [Patescibacteria group bacterium]